MFEILLIIGAIYVLAKISGPDVWIGAPPLPSKSFKGKGLPWLGNAKRNRRKREKYFWDD